MSAPSRSTILSALQYTVFNESGALGKDAPSTRTRVTFAFNATADTFSYQMPDGKAEYSGFRAWNVADETAVRRALAHIETFLNVDFVEVAASTDPEIDFAFVELDPGIAGEGGWTVSTAGKQITSHDAFAVFGNEFDIQTDQYGVVLHEIGHALGLRHSFDTGLLADKYDTNKYTLMAYEEHPGTGVSSDAMGYFDVFALQDIWGAAAYNTGDTTYTGSRTSTTDTIWDTGGTDVFEASNRSHRVKLDLREGAYSRFGGSYEDVAIAFDTVIEQARGGSGNDRIVGNAADNELSGNAGNDMLNGKQGNDTLEGGAGDDRLRGGMGGDRLDGGAGNDMLWGGAGADEFVYSGGTDRVRDFRDGTDLVRFAGFGDVADALALAEQRGADVWFDFGGDDILIVQGVKISDLDTVDFLT